MPGTRATGVARARQAEVDLVLRTGKGTRNWTKEEIAYIKKHGTLPDGYIGHHINSVIGHPEWAGDPRNIDFVVSLQPSATEH